MVASLTKHTIDAPFTGKITYTLASLAKKKKKKKRRKRKHTTAGIRWWSPTQLLTGRRVA